MRVDSDTYIWDVKRILIERKDEGDGNPRTAIRLVGDDVSGGAVSLYVWGDGTAFTRNMPEVVLIDEGRERVIVEAVPAPSREPKKGFNDWDNPKPAEPEVPPTEKPSDVFDMIAEHFSADEEDREV